MDLRGATAAGLDRDLGPDGLLLEVGCATGEFVEEATAVGYEAIGVEPSKWAADTARRSGAEVFCGTLADWRAEYDSFTVDAVAMFHVLEHLDDPVEVLRECRSCWLRMAGCSLKCRTLPVERRNRSTARGSAGSSGSTNGITRRRGYMAY